MKAVLGLLLPPARARRRMSRFSFIWNLNTIQNFLQAFEKKVKAQFSLVPFEEVTPVVEEVNLEEGDAKEAKKNDIDDGDTKKNGKDGEKAEEAENWGTVHDTPVTDDMEDDAETDLDKTEPFKEVEKNEEDKEEEKLKLREKMETERKRAEVKEKEDEESID